MADSNFTQELERSVRQACAELRERLRGGEDYRAEALFSRYADLNGDSEAALEVLYTEFVTREELGQDPSADDLYTRFPQWKERLQRLLDVHTGLRASDSGGGKADTLVFPTAHEVIDQGAFPKFIGPYEIIDMIGRGGMGAVFQAKHLKLKRLVALKRLLVGEWASAEEERRFRTEAETISRLDHVNIVKLFEIGEQEGQPHLVFELVVGGSLANLLTRGPLPALFTLDLLQPLARGLQHAHERGVLHRDLKPGNILLQTPDGVWPTHASDPLPTDAIPKIADFGLAKQLDASHGHSRTGSLVGTPAYVAPERLDGKGDGPAGDIYSLGVVMYECLTGRPPFLGDTPLATVALVREREPVPPTELQPDCPRDLATICMKCLQKDPRRRYASAADLADDLARFRADKPILARPTGRLEHLTKWSRRNPMVASLITLVVLLALGSGGVLTFLWLGAAQALDDAEKERQKTAETLASKLLILAQYEYLQSKVDDARINLEAIPEKYRDDAWRRLQRHVLAQRGLLKAEGRVHGFDFSPDGKYLAMYPAGPKENLWVWEHATGKVVFKAFVADVTGFAFTRDNKQLDVVSLGEANDPEKRTMTISTFHLDGKLAKTRSLPAPGNHVVTVFPEARKVFGIRVLLPSGADVLVWNLDDASLYRRHSKLRPSFGHVSPDGKKLGLYISDPPLSVKWKLEVIDLATGQLEKELRSQVQSIIYIAPDLGSYFSLVSFGERDIGKLTVYDAATSKMKWEHKQQGTIQAVDVSRDGAHIALGGLDRRVMLLNAKTGQEILALRGHASQVTRVRFSPDGRWLASADFDGIIRVWAVPD